MGQKILQRKSRSIRILQAEAIKAVDMSSSRKPKIASKVESTSRRKGKEVIRDPMPMSENGESDSMETEDEMPIQFGTLLPSNFLVNMAFTLPATFKAKKG